MLKPNEKLGQYQLIRSLGQGGMAEVHLAMNQDKGRNLGEVALKVIHPHLSQDREFVQMLIDEAELSIQLSHPNIVHTHRLGHDRGLYFIEMEFIDGCDVYQALVSCENRQKVIDFEVAAWVTHECCAGLYYAHTKRDASGQLLNIIHRDISPQNIQLSYAGDVKIVDFGIAKADQRQSHTQQGIIKGKYAYMSPEQAWGDQIDHRSDIFSLGICLFEMIAGEVLYGAEDGLGLLEQVRLAQIPNLRVIRPDLPPELERVVYKALQAEPAERYHSADEMRRDLAAYLSRFRASSGRERMTLFMRDLGLGTSSQYNTSSTEGAAAPHNDAEWAQEERTRAVSADQFKSLLVNGPATDFSDADKTQALNAESFSNVSAPFGGLMSSTLPAPMPIVIASSEVTSDFNQEDKTKAVSAEMFASLQTPNTADVIEDRTKAVHSSILQGLMGGTTPPPPPVSLLSSTTSTLPFDLMEEGKTKAFNTSLLTHLKESPIASTPPGPPPSVSPPPTPPPSVSPPPTPPPSVSPTLASPVVSSFPSPFSNASTEIPSDGLHFKRSEQEEERLNPEEPEPMSPITKTEEAKEKAPRKGKATRQRKSRTKERDKGPNKSKQKDQSKKRGRGRGSSASKLILTLGLLVIMVVVSLSFSPLLFKASTPKSYTLSVSSNAQGAKVYRDGQDTGQFTPALLQGLKPGVEYLIKLDSRGYEAKDQRVVYSPESLIKNKEQSLRLFLKRSKGTLKVKSIPSDASVYMNNSYLGKTPIYKRNVIRSESGIEIKFRKDGCESKTVILNWGDDLESQIKVPLKCK